MNELIPLTSKEETRRRRHVDISEDPKYALRSSEGDAECTDAPTRILDRILSLETQEYLFKNGHGTAPDLIYAKKVPDTPAPDPTTFDRKKCNLILIEDGLCRDFG